MCPGKRFLPLLLLVSCRVFWPFLLYSEEQEKVYLIKESEIRAIEQKLTVLEKQKIEKEELLKQLEDQMKKRKELLETLEEEKSLKEKQLRELEKYLQKSEAERRKISNLVPITFLAGFVLGVLTWEMIR